MLWPLVAVAATSVVGAAALVGLRSIDSESPDLYLGSAPDTRSYHVVDKPCTTIDLAVMSAAGFKQKTTAPDAPAFVVNRHPALDTAKCVMEFATADGRAKGRLATNVSVHKQTNPIPSFRAEFETAGQRPGVGGTQTMVEEVANLGDAAYIVYEARGMRATLRVRDGWFVYEVWWNSWGSSPGGISRDEQRKTLISIATSALPKWRQSP